MDLTRLLDSLNPAQREAVSAEPGHLLILAGAGSGKTRVLVHRMAYLLHTQQATPYSMLAVTFTNKAAQEMRGRVESILGHPAHGMWIGTFHGLAHRLLRAHWQEANLPENFQILDSDDQHRMVRRVLKSMDLDEDKWQPKQAQWFINHHKDAGHRANDVPMQNDPFTDTLIEVYRYYEQTCQQSGLVDFAELLLRAYEVWQKTPALLEHYQQRFNHILVDEFQDTNTIQYKWLRLLAGESAYFMIVGDDDQSIYGWRGAKIENIQRFNRDYPGTKTIRLEQNYRSTGVILEAANSLIANNTERLGKELWSDGERGAPIALYAAYNEQDEARFIVERVESWVASARHRSDVAVLYRSNAQSRVIEEAMIKAGLPYRIYGGQRFFERAEIKDAMGYLRMMANPHDDAAFERIINMPPRGIGGITLDIVRNTAREQAISLWAACEYLIESVQLSTRAQQTIGQFLDIIKQLSVQCRDHALEQQTEIVLKGSGLLAYFQQQRHEKAHARVENLEELVTAASQFEPEEGNDLPPLLAFLSHAALEAGETQAADHEDCVQMMTLHAAKGLEFPLVFMAGLEDGLFPSQMSMQEDGKLEEERRLCYVGMTRAMQQLVMSYAETRRIYGKESFQSPSRFIQEIPSNLLQEVRARPKTRTLGIGGGVGAGMGGSIPGDFTRGYNRNLSSGIATQINPAFGKADVANDLGLALGQRVTHARFGEGVILNFEGHGEQARVQVYFESVGSKWLVASFAKLEPV